MAFRLCQNSQLSRSLLLVSTFTKLSMFVASMRTKLWIYVDKLSIFRAIDDYVYGTPNATKIILCKVDRIANFGSQRDLGNAYSRSEERSRLMKYRQGKMTHCCWMVGVWPLNHLLTHMNCTVKSGV